MLRISLWLSLFKLRIGKLKKINILLQKNLLKLNLQYQKNRLLKKNLHNKNQRYLKDYRQLKILRRLSQKRKLKSKNQKITMKWTLKNLKTKNHRMQNQKDRKKKALKNSCRDKENKNVDSIHSVKMNKHAHISTQHRKQKNYQFPSERVKKNKKKLTPEHPQLHIKQSKIKKNKQKIVDYFKMYAHYR